MKVRGRGEQVLERGFYGDPGGPAFFQRIEVTASGRELPCDVELHAEVVDGAYAVVDVRCSRKRGGGEVTSEALRAAPIARILRAGALLANRGLHPGPEAEEVRAQGPTDESLRVVAVVYRMAYLVRDNPTRAVASALGLPHPTASRWVARAREAGFLGAAEPRKAGERPKRKGK